MKNYVLEMLAHLLKQVYSYRVPKLKLIHGTNPPATLKESVRSDLRKTKVKEYIQCPTCGSRTAIPLETAGIKQKACAFCFINEKLIVLME